MAVVFLSARAQFFQTFFKNSEAAKFFNAFQKILKNKKFFNFFRKICFSKNFQSLCSTPDRRTRQCHAQD